MRSAFETGSETLADVDQDFFRRHDDHGTSGAASDDQHFIHGRVNDHFHLTAFEHEPAEDTDTDDDGADDDDHVRLAVVAC